MISFEDIRNYCLSKGGVTEDFPFDMTTLVFRVGDKMFLLTDVQSKELSVNLKCEPGLSLQLRSTYESVKPGYHMNKKHWNTVIIDGNIPDKEIFMMIDHSYDLVFKKLKKSEKDKILAVEDDTIL